MTHRGPGCIPGRIVCWNVGPRPAWRVMRSLGELRKDHRADLVGLFEATRACPAIRVRYGVRNRVIRRGSDVVAIVSRKLPKPKVEVIGHNVPWVGPKQGKRHQGRRHLLLDFDGDGVLLLHRVPGGPSGGRIKNEQGSPANLDAWQTEAELIALVCRRRSLRTLRVLGDQNATAEELAAFWRALDMRLIRTGLKVDHGAQRGAATRAFQLESYGSDHRAVCYEECPCPACSTSRRVE